MGLFGKLFGSKEQPAQPPAGEKPEAITSVDSSSVGDDTPVVGPAPEPKAPMMDVAPPPPQPTEDAQPPADSQPPAAK